MIRCYHACFRREDIYKVFYGYCKPGSCKVVGAFQQHQFFIILDGHMEMLKESFSAEEEWDFSSIVLKNRRRCGNAVVRAGSFDHVRDF